MSLWKRLFWGSFSGAAGVLLKTLINLLIIPCMMSMLGTSIYGLYVLLVGLIEMSTMLDFGFSSALINELGTNLGEKNSQKIKEYLNLGQFFYGILSILILILGFLFSPQLIHLFHLPESLYNSANGIFGITFITCAVYLYSSYYRAILLAHCCHQWTNISDMLNQILGNALGLCAILLGYGLIGFLAVRLFTTLLTSIFLFRKASQLEPSILLRPFIPKFEPFKKIYHLSIHAAFIQLSIIISHRIDMFVIGSNLTLSAVSLYELIFRVLSVISQLISQICQGFFPAFARLTAEKDNIKVRQFFLTISFLMNFLSILMFICVIPFFPNLLAIFSAKKITFAAAAPILPYAVPIFWSAALQFPGAYYLFTAGHQKFISTTSIITALCNLGISLLLVKPLGVVGVVLGTLIPLLIQHQIFNIGKSLQSLEISIKEYILSVHLRLIPTIGLSLTFLYIFKAILGMTSPLNIASIIFIDFFTCIFSLMLCYSLATSEQEKTFIRDNLLLPLKSRLNRRIENVPG